jgi:hypothetical protein
MFKSKILLILITVLVSVGYLKAQDMSIEQFDSLDSSKQMVFVNSLNKQEKIRFLAKYLPDHLFAVYPVSLVKFFSDGEFIFDCEAEGGGMIGGDGKSKPYKYYIGKWYFKNETIIIDNPNSKINIFGKYFIFDDVKCEAYKGQSTHFIFHIIKGIDRDGKNIIDDEADLWDGTPDLKSRGLSPAIDSYTKLKQSKSNKKK